MNTAAEPTTVSADCAGGHKGSTDSTIPVRNKQLSLEMEEEKANDEIEVAGCPRKRQGAYAVNMAV